MLSLKPQIGRSTGVYRDAISEVRISAFCKAVGAPVSLAAPPTFLTVFRKGEFDLFNELGLELSQVLHAEQEYQHENAVRAGDCVCFETRVAQVLEKQGSTTSLHFIIFETNLRVERNSEEYRIGKAKTTVVVREKGGVI